MKDRPVSVRFVFPFAFLLICCFVTQAQNRVFVSGLGDDANPCTRTLPCRNFQRGHDAVVSGGEVVALDSAGYGQITITKSVTITGEGVYAGITASSGNGVSMDTAGITVNLRSLRIEGLGSGNRGIAANDFTALHVENCIVSGFVEAGLVVFPSTAGTRRVFVKDSSCKNNGTAGMILRELSGATALSVTIEGTSAENNSGHGVFVSDPGVTVTARHCAASGNGSLGFASINAAVLSIETCVASHNGLSGIETSSATVRVSNSTVTNNTEFGFYNSSGTFESRGNNTVAGNNGSGAQTTGTITVLAGI